MKTCRNCAKRDRCAELCEDMKKLLGEDEPQRARNIYTGKLHKVKQLRGRE